MNATESKETKDASETLYTTTSTIVINTNFVVDIQILFVHLPVVDIAIPLELRGEKKIRSYISGLGLPSGSIICVKDEKQHRGFNLKENKKNKKKVATAKPRAFFRNSLMIDMIIGGDKIINFKFPKKGSIQMTGCKHFEHAQECISHMWSCLVTLNAVYKDTYILEGEHQNPRIVLHMVMMNKRYHLNFRINKRKLNDFINENDGRFRSSFEETVGYTGIKIKYPIDIDRSRILCPIMEYVENEYVENEYVENEYVENECVENEYVDNEDVENLKIDAGKTRGNWIHKETGTYEDFYQEFFSEKRKEADEYKYRAVSFLVFPSGSIIISGIKEYINEPFQLFIELIRRAEDYIKE